MKKNNKVKERPKRNLYDFDYESEEEKQLKQKLKADKKSASKRRRKNKKKEQVGQAKRKPRYDDEIIIGVTEIPRPDTNQKPKAKNRKESAINRINVKPKENKKRKKNKKEKDSDIYNNVKDDYIIEDTFEERDRELKRKQFRFKIVKYTSLVILIIGVIVFAMVSPIFNVTNIIVTGNSKLTVDEVKSLSKIENNENIFRISKSSVTNNIKQNAYVNKVEIHKNYPNSIQIVIEERVPNFMLQFGNGYVYINNQGYMLEISSEKLNLPIISGFSTPQENLVEGNRLIQEDLEKLETVIRIISSAQSNGIANLITSIDISDANNYTLYLESEKKTVYLGDCSNLGTRILYLVGILENEKEHEGEIFINMNLNTDYPFFREKV